MNIKNANKELGFDIFAKCDYNLHWSFSNFNRVLMVAGLIARLPLNSKVLELGAGSSDLENIVKTNFKRNDIRFYKVDGDNQYEFDEQITVLNIMSRECDDFCERKGPFDAVVFMEVIEHLFELDRENIVDRISHWLSTEGLLLITTPTPPCEGMYETEVWPDDHFSECTHSQIYKIVNKYFKVTKEIGWSLEEREYNKLIEQDESIWKVYSKLKGAFPESYIRAIIACIAPVEMNRQVLLVCKKRRIANGRFAPPR